MKNRGWLSLLGVALILASSGHAQQAPEAGMVEIEVHTAKATAKQLEEIFGKNAGSQKFGPLPTPIPSAPAFIGIAGVLTAEQTTQALKNLKEKGAKIGSTPRTAALSGEKARVQNVREIRYPSKYSEPDAAGKTAPVEFETKPVGTTMEIEPTIGPDGITIDLTLSIQVTHLLGFGNKSATTGKPANPAPTGQQPQFKTHEVTTAVTIYSGGTVLFAAPAENANTPADLVFVTARKLSAP